MNWKIACKIWLSGWGIFSGLCIFFFPIGILAIVVSLLISWIAIPLYAGILWLCRKLKATHVTTVFFLLLIAAPSAVAAALATVYFYDSELADFTTHITFWIPLLCCVTSILSFSNSIRFYLNPYSALEVFIIE